MVAHYLPSAVLGVRATAINKTDKNLCCDGTYFCRGGEEGTVGESQVVRFLRGPYCKPVSDLIYFTADFFLNCEVFVFLHNFANKVKLILF